MAHLTAAIDSNGRSCQLLVQAFEGLALVFHVDVAVHIHGHLNRAVTHDLHHDPRMDALAAGFAFLLGVDSKRATDVTMEELVR